MMISIHVFRTLAFLAILIVVGCTSTTEEKNDLSWIQLFNGDDLEDWIIKISKHELGENFANTFRVEDGLMKVRYDGYEDFDQQYGHIFYKEPFSHYLLRVEYRFVGDQAPGGEGWAFRNSGAMLHSQNPQTMLKDQDFPISIEGQLLGGDGENERTTSNLCTPGTHVVMNGELFTPHCVSSSSKTYHGDQWVTAEFLVLGDSIVYHILEGKSVISYEKPQIGGGNVHPVDPEVKIDGTPLTSGFISLQSESHPIDFRKVELVDLSRVKNSKTQLDAALIQLGYGDFTSLD
ncbi:MAG: 3-keto-disaccharide hydrolase [Cecembia sp.]